MDNLKELMGHIEYFYQPIKSVYDSDLEYEVYLKDGRWTITNLKDGQIFGTTDHEKTLEYLTENKADLSIFHVAVYQCVVNEGVLRRMQLKNVEKLVGIEAIDKQDEAWKDFAKGLVETIEKEMNKPNLRAVE